jgi:hypothetical protein
MQAGKRLDDEMRQTEARDTGVYHLSLCVLVSPLVYCDAV